MPDREIRYIQRRHSMIPIKPGTEPVLKKGDKIMTDILKGDEDGYAKRRAFMQDYCRKRGLLGLKEESGEH